MRFRRLFLTLFALPSAMWMSNPVVAESDMSFGVLAWFEGDLINLAEGWGEATTCSSDGFETHCYRTRKEIEGVQNSEAKSNAIDPTATLLASCASSLTLYNGTGFGGSSLSLSARGVAIDLAAYGFSNVASSYSIGACAAEFYDGVIGSASYPGNTNAFASASSMATGWNNRISTVYIY